MQFVVFERKHVILTSFSGTTQCRNSSIDLDEVVPYRSR